MAGRGARPACYNPSMTKLLTEAWAAIQELEESEQDRLAMMILEDIESEKRWDELFAKSQDMLEEMAAQARAEFDAGLTDELTPDKL